jgi:crotonobetainyl-CoA:carnitine CoA-transferase CaiB-like acyl-CoA transferase
VAAGHVLLGGAPRRRLICALVSAMVESSVQEWEREYRSFVDVSDPTVAERLAHQLEVITAELRRRVGGAFTIAELADEYARADVWARHVLSEQEMPDWPQTLALVEGAAFHLYARGAVDYEP